MYKNTDLVAASKLCSDLASELDNNNYSNVTNVAQELKNFTPEVIILSVKEHIGLERIVKHDLDTYKDFNDIFLDLAKYNL